MGDIQQRLSKQVRVSSTSGYDCLFLSDSDSMDLAKEFYTMLKFQGALEKAISGFPSIPCEMTLAQFCQEIRDGMRDDLTLRGVSLRWFCGEKESYLARPSVRTLLNC